LGEAFGWVYIYGRTDDLTGKRVQVDGGCDGNKWHTLTSNMGGGSDKFGGYITYALPTGDFIEGACGCGVGTCASAGGGPTHCGQPVTVSVQKNNIKIDGSVCDSTWCPWSEYCKSQSLAMQNYCSQMDEHGYPRFHTDVNCNGWCGSEQLVGKCGMAAQQFCAAYPNHLACYCQNYTSSDAFKKVVPEFEVVPGCEACTAIPPAVCWAFPCTVGETLGGPYKAMFNTQQQKDKDKQCQGTSVNICDMVLDIFKAGGNVTIANNDFEQVCGKQLKRPSGPPPPASTPSPSTPSTPSPSSPSVPSTPSPSSPWMPLTPSAPSTPSSGPPGPPHSKSNLLPILIAIGVVVIIFAAIGFWARHSLLQIRKMEAAKKV
jgi:hypothetical protein